MKYEVYDIVLRQVVFEGTQEQCDTWLDAQSDWYTYRVQPQYETRLTPP